MKKKQIVMNSVETIPFHVVLNNIKLEAAKASVLSQGDNRHVSARVTVDLIDAVAPALVMDDRAVDEVCSCVEYWIQEKPKDYEEIQWQADLAAFASVHKDIIGVYATAKNSDNYEFIIIVEDVIQDSVFEYNEFCFEFSEKYTNVVDFMVIDLEEAEGCHDLLDSYDVIYKRG